MARHNYVSVLALVRKEPNSKTQLTEEPESLVLQRL